MLVCVPLCVNHFTYKLKVIPPSPPCQKTTVITENSNQTDDPTSHDLRAISLCTIQFTSYYIRYETLYIDDKIQNTASRVNSKAMFTHT